jgi:hypothetical protein
MRSASPDYVVHAQDALRDPPDGCIVIGVQHRLEFRHAHRYRSEVPCDTGNSFIANRNRTPPDRRWIMENLT